MKKTTIVLMSWVALASWWNAGAAWTQPPPPPPPPQSSFAGNWIAEDTTEYLYFDSNGSNVEVRRLGYDGNGDAIDGGCSGSPISSGCVAEPSDDCNKTDEGSESYANGTMTVSSFASSRRATCTTDDGTATVMGNADLTGFNQGYTYTSDATNGDYLTGGTDSKKYRKFSRIASLKIETCQPPANVVTGTPTGCTASPTSGTYGIYTSAKWVYPSAWASSEGFVVRPGKVAILHFQEFVANAVFNSTTTDSVQWFQHARATSTATTLPDRMTEPDNIDLSVFGTSGDTKLEIYNRDTAGSTNDYESFLLYLDITRGSVVYRHPIDPTLIDKGPSPGQG